MKKTILFLVLGCLTTTLQAQTKDFFQQIKTEKVTSDPSIEWENFGPGMSGYCEEFWNHPTDANVMFMGPDMHVSYGTWDDGKSWHSLKDHDGLGHDMKRVLDIEFSLQNPDYGMAIDWNGWVFETVDRGRSWKKTIELGGSHTDVNIDPNDPKSFEKGWYYEQEGTRMSELAVDPTDDSIWYAGAGDFWNVKSNHRSAANPNGIFLKYAVYGCIYKSTDKGRSWKKITKGLHEKTDVGKIIVDPNNNQHVIMATNFGLMRSTDGGLSWKKSGKGLPNNLPRDLTSYYDSKTNEFVLYLVDQTVYENKGNTVTTKGGLFKSTDGGKNWKDITGNLYFDMTALHSNAEVDRFHKTMGHWFGISKSESKKKFTALPTKTLPVFNRLVVNPLNKDEIYVSYNRKHDFTFGPGDVWRSLDGGKTWITCARYGPYWTGNNDLDYWKDRNNPTGTNIKFAHLQTYMNGTSGTSGNRMMSIGPKGNLYIGINQQTLKSTDKGKTWKQVDDYETSPGSNKWIGRGDSNLPGRFMLLETGIKNRRLLCSGEHGLWQTTDLEGWPDKQAVAVEQIEGQVHDHSGNHGAHSISTVAVHPQDPNTIFVLSWRQEHRGKLRKTTDGGKTWTNIATIFEAANNSWEGLAPQNSLLIDPNNPNTMYFCSTARKISEIGGGKPEKLTKGGYGFYRSFDGGLSWELSNTGFHKNASVRRIIMHPNQPETLYAALNDKNGGLYISKNKGSNWEKMTIPSVINSVNNVFIDRNTKDILISTGQRSGTYEEGGVWRSLDQGNTWQQIFKAPFVWQAETSPLDPKLIVISAAGQQVTMSGKFMNPGIYLSTDGGKSWKKINKGLGQPDKIVDVKPDPYNKDVLWCAGWGSGWFVSYLNGSTDGWAK